MIVGAAPLGVLPQPSILVEALDRRRIRMLLVKGAHPLGNERGIGAG